MGVLWGLKDGAIRMDSVYEGEERWGLALPGSLGTKTGSQKASCKTLD